MDWYLYGRDHRHEIVKEQFIPQSSFHDTYIFLAGLRKNGIYALLICKFVIVNACINPLSAKSTKWSNTLELFECA